MSGVADEQRLSVLFVQLNASSSHTSLVETRKELKKRSENGGGTVRTYVVGSDCLHDLLSF